MPTAFFFKYALDLTYSLFLICIVFLLSSQKSKTCIYVVMVHINIYMQKHRKYRIIIKTTLTKHKIKMSYAARHMKK